ncbi:hypothetical protein IWX49DRAFT_398978 [Phyllosticta citricarpa]
MASNTCSFYTHTGSVTAYSAVPALRFLHGYLSALDSNNLAAFSPKTFFTDAALYHAADGTTYRSDQEIWDATKTRFQDMEFMHHQTCVTRVFGPDVKRLGCGEKHVINSQTIMLCRLKGWEEERMLEIPRVFEFVIGKVEDPPPSPLDADEELRSGTFCSRTVSWISAHLVWCWKSPGAAFGERFRNLSQQGAFNEERQGSFAGSNLPPCRVSNTKQQCPGAHCLPSVSKDATILAWVAGIRSSRRFRPRRDSWRTTRPSSRLTLGCSDPSGSRTSSRKTIQRRVRALVLDICLDRPPSLGTKIHRRCVAGLRCCFDRQRVATADEHDGCFVACSIFRC